jgi:periplasmic copper chaperone A
MKSAFRAIALLSVFLPSLALAHDYKIGDLEIEHPWARATMPGQEVAGGFLTITNKGDAADRLIAVETDVSNMTQVHEMAMESGVMKMRELAGGLEIKPGETVVLKPKSFHVMFMGLGAPLTEKQSFDAVLVFEKAGKLPVQFNVEAMGSEGMHH